MKYNKVLAFVLSLAIVFALSACGEKNNHSDGEENLDKVYEMKCSTYVSSGSLTMPLLEEFTQNVSDKTDGHVKITIYPGEQLGGYEQTFEETMRGTIEFGMNSVAATYDSRLSSAYIPAAVSNYDELQEMFSPGSIVFENYAAACDDLGLKFFGFFTEGFQNMSFADKPESSYADPSVKKGDVIRVNSTNAITKAAVEALGYSTAGLPGSEVYSALQTGIINGTVGQSDSMVLSGYSDVVDSIVNYRLYCTADCIFMNKKLFDSMPAEYQQAITDAAAEMLESNMTFLKEQATSLVDELKAKGVEYIELTDDERQNCYDAIRADVWPMLEEMYGVDYMASVRELVGAD